jgi:1,4-alpha-glucan branching enzyme
VWLNEATRWTWPLVHEAEARFARLVERGLAASPDPLLDRLLAQAGRECLLLESSDWQFLISTVAARDYAEQRVRTHAEDFARLAGLGERRAQGGSLGEADEQFLAACELRDPLFPDFEWRAYGAHAATGAATRGA